MKHFSCLVALAVAPLATVLAPGVALAQMQSYYHAGAWDAFSGRSPNGGAVCGVGTTPPNENKRLAIRFDIGGSTTSFSASKQDWTIPANTHVTVVMQIGLAAPWTLQGVAEDSGHAIDWTLDRNAFQTFDQQFRAAPSMTVSFPDGNEQPWTLSLSGSSVISDTFQRCVRDLTRQVQAVQGNAAPPPQVPTQPFGAAGSPAPNSASPNSGPLPNGQPNFGSPGPGPADAGAPPPR